LSEALHYSYKDINFKGNTKARALRAKNQVLFHATKPRMPRAQNIYFIKILLIRKSKHFVANSALVASLR